MTPKGFLWCGEGDLNPHEIAPASTSTYSSHSIPHDCTHLRAIEICVSHWRLRRKWLFGSERESDGEAILGCFLDRVHGDEFGVGHGHPLGLQ